MTDRTRTGQRCPRSGIWRPANGARELALSKGDRVPPAGGEAAEYQLVRPTEDPPP